MHHHQQLPPQLPARRNKLLQSKNKMFKSASRQRCTVNIYTHVNIKTSGIFSWKACVSVSICNIFLLCLLTFYTEIFEWIAKLISKTINVSNQNRQLYIYLIIILFSYKKCTFCIHLIIILLLRYVIGVIHAEINIHLDHLRISLLLTKKYLSITSTF